MAITIEATYENGVLKPDQPLSLGEHQRVRVTVLAPDEVQSACEAVQRSYGLIGWTGDVETARRVAEDPEFGILECP
jgi:predicted DNA-binding antitoxin AbrB/MazE fold protein